MRLLAISGSLREGSYNTSLLHAAATECPAVELVVWRDLAEIPAFDEDLLVVPPAVAALRGAISRADAVLIATPEYNGSIPGALKNALDWASRPFDTNALRGKPTAVIGASTGLFGAVRAQAELRKVLRAIGADVDDRDLPVPRAHEAFTPDGRLRDPQLAAALKSLVEQLRHRTRKRAA